MTWTFQPATYDAERSTSIGLELAPMTDAYEFDVALSFAGDDREYVTEVAHALRAANISYFLDSEYLAETWGEDLVEFFDAVYRTQARYAVLFISRHYADREWPRSERRSALARALTERGAYILPVRLDDTEIDGLRPTVGYLDARRLGIDALVTALIAKLAGRSSGPQGWPGDRSPRGQKEIAAVMAEQPPAWEYLSMAGLLLEERDSLDDRYRDHLLKYAEPSGEAVADEAVFDWMRARLDEVRAIVRTMARLMEPDTQVRAFGAPGVAGDAVFIRHVASRWNAGYRQLMEWAARLRGAQVDDAFRDLIDRTADLASGPIRQYRQFVDAWITETDELPAWLARPEGEREPRHINLTLEIAIDPEDLAAHSAEIEVVGRHLEGGE